MKLYQPDGTSVPGTTLDNVELNLDTDELSGYCLYLSGGTSYKVAEVEAHTVSGSSGPSTPDPDGDGGEEAIIRFTHASGRTLKFVPSPPDVQWNNQDEYRVEFAVPSSPGDPPKVWNGDVEIHENATIKKKLPLKVTVTKAGPGA